MKLWMYKNRINVTEATFFIQNSLSGNMFRTSKRFHFVPCDV